MGGGCSSTHSNIVLNVSNDKSLRKIKRRVRNGVYLAREVGELEVISNGMHP